MSDSVHINTKNDKSFKQCNDNTWARQVVGCEGEEFPTVSTTPNILNEAYEVANVIQSIALPANTKAFTIKHRDRGTVEFSFNSSLTTYLTIPRGGQAYEWDLKLNETLYFRSPRTGTIEILAWT